jgi:hypothetical protein
MSITTTRSSSQALAGALQAHRDAAERHRRAVAQAGVAPQAHTAASAAREQVLARASEGADVGLAELQRAAEAATDAGDLPWLPRCAMARFPLCTRRTSRRLSLPSTITMPAQARLASKSWSEPRRWTGRSMLCGRGWLRS